MEKIVKKDMEQKTVETDYPYTPSPEQLARFEKTKDHVIKKHLNLFKKLAR